MTRPEADWTELHGYLAGSFADTELLNDESAAVERLSRQTLPGHQQALELGRKALASPDYDWKQIPDYANRTLTSRDDALGWLKRMMDALERGIKNL